MNDLYMVAVRLHGWEFMAEASHINAKKAVRGLASDLQEFHAQAQGNSAAQLMQQGAAAGEAVAQITGEEAEMQREERRLELKRKAVDLELSARERDIAMDKEKLSIDREKFTLNKEMKEWEKMFPLDIELKTNRLQYEKEECEKFLITNLNKAKLENTEKWMSQVQEINPDWRADARLYGHMRDQLLSIPIEYSPEVITGGGDEDERLESASLTVRMVADSLKIQRKITGRVDEEMLRRAGREIAQLYREKHQKSPPEQKEMHNGHEMVVKSYTEADRPMLETVIMRVVTAGSAPLTNYFPRQ